MQARTALRASKLRRHSHIAPPPAFSSVQMGSSSPHGRDVVEHHVHQRRNFATPALGRPVFARIFESRALDDEERKRIHSQRHDRCARRGRAACNYDILRSPASEHVVVLREKGSVGWRRSKPSRGSNVLQADRRSALSQATTTPLLRDKRARLR